MALDDLVDDVEKEHEKEQAKGILDELGVENKEELEKLEQKLDRVQAGLENYDQRMERIEDELKVLQGAVARLVRQTEKVHDEADGGSEAESQNNSGLDW